MGPPNSTSYVMGPPNSTVAPTKRTKPHELPFGKPQEEQSSNGSGEMSPVTRGRMKKYWEVFSPSIESMMLSHDAPQLSVDEQKEVMSYLPQQSYVGKNVLELGAGIGRYTSLLSDGGAAQVTAVDFIDSYVKENQRINGHKDNVTLLCADVTKLNFKEHSFDLVFSNWLLMYLTDSEVESLLRRALNWLKPGGFLFIRESCYHPSGNVKRGENPTLYRTPLDYSGVISKFSEDAVHFKLVKAKNLQTYIKYNNNPNQLCFLVRQESDDSLTGDEFLASSGDMAAGVDTIMLREAINGKGWLNRGSSESLMSRMGPVSGQRVLVATCGSGGLAFELAKQGAASVHGLAPTPSALHFALRHQEAQTKDILQKTSFELCMDLEGGFHYDVVCACDLSLSAGRCSAAVSRLTSMLSSGGRLLLGAYTSRGLSPDTDGGLPTVAELQSAAVNAGLRDVTVSECPGVLTSLSGQLDALQHKDTLVQDYSTALLAAYSNELEDTISKLQSGEIVYSVLQGAL